jgi:protein tyrosine/serine phosphatase
VKWCQSAEYIDASLEEAVKQYGSVQAYIREGLGITDKELVNFREQLLEPAK